MVKVMFYVFTAGMTGEGSKPPYGEGTSDGDKDEEKSSKGSGGKPLPYPPYSPKFPLIAALEEPKVLSQEAEIEEVQIAQEADLIEGVQAS